MNFDIIILGAGPTGLSAAHKLIDLGLSKSRLLVLEKEDVAGGLCRSADVDGSPLDIGGGHFLDVRKPDVLDLLFRFLPVGEWNHFDRIAKIRLHGQEVDHPLEANLWQFSTRQQVDYLESLAFNASRQADLEGEDFESWIRGKFGGKIAEEYMLPYNRKIWDMDLSRLGTYWLHKLPAVSFREVLTSCIERRPTGKLPAHGEFFYPKRHGYGEVWRRMGEELGNSLFLQTPVSSLDFHSRTVNGKWFAKCILNTLPWTVFQNSPDLPPGIRGDIQSLISTSIDVDYHPQSSDSTAHWIYEPDEGVSYHRILARENFCTGACGYWTETNSRRNRAGTALFRHHNEFAYPVNTIGKPEAIGRITSWASRFKVFGAGRWGLWDHMNSDVAVQNGMDAAGAIAKEIL